MKIHQLVRFSNLRQGLAGLALLAALAAAPVQAEVGVQVFKLAALDAAEDDEFGFSVNLNGDKALVGARYDDETGSTGDASHDGAVNAPLTLF